MWELLAKPALWLLRPLHDALGDWGFALSMLSAVSGAIGVVVGHFARRRMDRQGAALDALAPEINRLQRAHAADRAGLKRELTEMYRRAGVNPLSGILTSGVASLPFAILGLSVFAALLSDPALARASFLWLPALGDPDPRYLLPAIVLGQGVLAWLLVPPSRDPEASRSKGLELVFAGIVPAACLLLSSGVVLFIAVRRVLYLLVSPFYYRRHSRCASPPVDHR